MSNSRSRPRVHIPTFRIGSHREHSTFADGSTNQSNLFGVPSGSIGLNWGEKTNHVSVDPRIPFLGNVSTHMWPRPLSQGSDYSTVAIKGLE